MKHLALPTLVCVLTLAACLNTARGDTALAAEFRDPPAAARPHTWWHWMNGNISRQGITKDLEAMKRVGLAGFQLFNVTDGIPTGPVDYLSPQWLDLMEHAIDEAERLGLGAGMHNGAGWSSSGGPWITPELSMQELVWTETQLTGGKRIEVALEPPQARRDFYRDVAVIAFPAVGKFRLDKWQWKGNHNVEKRGPALRFERDSRRADEADIIRAADVVVLTDRMDSSGKLTWDAAPAGEWTVLRFGHTTTGRTNVVAPPAGHGLECNKLDRGAVKAHWDNSVAPVLKRAGGRAGKTFTTVHIDSYEVRLQNWTSGLDAAFAQRTGYELAPYMPCLTGRIVESVETTESFLWDWRHVIASVMAENYYGYVKELCHDAGVKLMIEPYNLGGFDYYQVAAIADAPMGEFWVDRPDAWHEWSVKLAASAAHAKGQNLVAAEAFTSRPPASAWRDFPSHTKPLGDRFFADGLNQIVFHTWVHQPWADDVQPGMTMGPHGIQFNRNSTWHHQARPWIDHLARTQLLLQQGRPVIDLCYLAPENPPHAPFERQDMTPVPPTGHDYDMLHHGFLMQMSVKDGRLVLPSGMSYAALVLPDDDRMRPEILTKVVELRKAGAKVFVTRPIIGSPSLVGGRDADRKTKELAASLPAAGQDLAELVGPPDVEAPPEVVWAHRRIDERDVYFIANQQRSEIAFDAVFRAAGEVEIWRTLDGTIERATGAQPVEGRTRVPMRLGPTDSVFVVFAPKSSAPPARRFVAAGQLPLDGPWKVRFEQDEIDLPRLISWPDHPDERIRYFSGTATYTMQFNAPADAVEAALLDLGEVHVIASVKLNGKDLGVLWKPPFAVHVSDALRPGANELEISVTNTWVNRLIGDEQHEPLGGQWRQIGQGRGLGLVEIPQWLTQGEASPPTQRKAFSTWRFFKKGDPLHPSGLIGPVILQTGRWTTDNALRP